MPVVRIRNLPNTSTEQCVRALQKENFLLVFEGVGMERFPLTKAIFREALVEACRINDIIPITMSNFKIGILSELWEYALDVNSDFKADVRLFLQVADHKPDYHQNYIVPDLLEIRKRLQKVRRSKLDKFWRQLSAHERI